MIRVQVFKDGELLQKQEFNKSEIIFGREREADVQLVAAAVSRRHARLARVQGKWQIADLGAANGVYVSKGKAEPERLVLHFLEPEDRIHIETFVIAVEELGGDFIPDVKAFDDLQEEISLETKRTQFISMHDVLNGPDGERLRALGVEVSSSKEANSTQATAQSASAITEVKDAEPAQNARSWSAEMTSDDGHGRTFQLENNSVLVGTAATCDIVLPAGPAQIVELTRSNNTVSLTRIGRWPFPRVTVDGLVVKDAMLNHKDSFFVGKFEVTLFLKHS